MSFGLSSKRLAGQQQPGPQDSPAYAVPSSGGGGHGFLIFSALLHIGAVVVLMHAWSGGLPRAKAETTTATSVPQQPATPRLAIDTAPVQYCEMDIEKIASRPLISQPNVAQPQVSQPQVSQPHTESFR